MKYRIVTILCLFCLVSYTIAGVELGIDVGYGFPANTFQDEYFLPSFEAEGTVTDTTENFSKFRDKYYSLGKGIKIGVDMSIALNDNLDVFASTGISFLGIYTIKNIITYEGEKITEDIKIKGNFLPINAGLKFKSELGKIAPYIYIAPGLYIPLGVKGETESKTGGVTEESSLKLKYALGLGIASGIGAVIKISDALGIKFELSPVYASARVREAEIENDNVKYTVKFEKNEKDLPEDTQKTIYEHGGPKHSFSSLSVKAGVVLGF